MMKPGIEPAVPGSVADDAAGEAVGAECATGAGVALGREVAKGVEDGPTGMRAGAGIVARGGGRVVVGAGAGDAMVDAAGIAIGR